MPGARASTKGGRARGAPTLGPEPAAETRRTDSREAASPHGDAGCVLGANSEGLTGFTVCWLGVAGLDSERCAESAGGSRRPARSDPDIESVPSVAGGCSAVGRLQAVHVLVISANGKAAAGRGGSGRPARPGRHTRRSFNLSGGSLDCFVRLLCVRV